MDEVTFSHRELYESVWKEPILRLSKKYDISDVGLRKMCVRMEIPLPSYSKNHTKFRYLNGIMSSGYITYYLEIESHFGKQTNK